MKTMELSEFLAEAEKRFGPNSADWKFVCPACGTSQSARDLVAAGVPKEKVDSYIGFSCIGRFTNQGDKGITMKQQGKPWNKGCNWTLGGLFSIHELTVIKDGVRHAHFDLAPAPRSEEIQEVIP